LKRHSNRSIKIILSHAKTEYLARKMRIADNLRQCRTLVALSDWIVLQLKNYAVFWLVISIFIERSSQAETIVSSLVESPSYVNFKSGIWLTSSFQTDTQPWLFSSANFDLANGGGGTADVYLLSDNGGQPGMPLAYLGSQTIDENSPYIFSASQIVRLDPSTTYWIALGNTSTDGGLNVSLSFFSDDFTFTNIPGASMAFSACDGESSGTDLPPIWNPSVSGVALLFAVDGTLIKLSEPYIAGIQASNGTYCLKISNLQCGQIIELEGSTNLINWTSFQTNMTSGTTLSFTNCVNSQIPCQFFRASAH
jgi:hypothetical protein